MKNSDLSVFILAGGFGKRLRSIIHETPKVLVRIKNKPLILYILDQLVDEGFQEVFILTGYKSQQVEETLGCRYKNLNLNFSRESKPLGTGGAVKKASNKTNKDYLLIINGDTLTNVSRKAFINKVDKNKEAIMSLFVKNISRYGLLEFDENNFLKKIYEKTGKNETGFINAGTYLFLRKNIFNFHKEVFSLEKDYIPTINKKKSIQIVPMQFQFLDVGIPEDFRQAENFINEIKK